MKYRAIFFDLDRTLWDLERNNAETLYDLYHYFRLPEQGIRDPLLFMEIYNRVNQVVWDLYKEEKIDKDTLRWKRFYDTFIVFGLDDLDLARRFSSHFLSISPLKTNLIPYALELLEYLKNNYDLYVITNGFEETQTSKLAHCGLMSYFKNVFISERIGYKKPDIRLFRHALKEAGVEPSQALMVGDEYDSDIKGGIDAGMDQAYFVTGVGGNYRNVQATYIIHSMKELQDIL